MKKTIMNLAAVCVFALMAGTAAANNNTGVELRNAGKEQNQPVYQLDIRNKEKQLYFITVTDQDGVVLYEESVRGENISRRFRLNTDELHNAVLTVKVSTRKNTNAAVYSIKVNTRTVQEAELVPAGR